jgi:hypothetical protein
MAKILCVEADVAVRESRCAVLSYAGYDAASATPHLAADVLVLDGFTMPLELLGLVAERLNRQQRA